MAEGAFERWVLAVVPRVRALRSFPPGWFGAPFRGPEGLECGVDDLFARRGESVGLVED